MLCALIMAGGKGTRFWPLSTEEKPKQFLNLIGNKTMIQMTVDRIQREIPIERIFICTGERYVELVKKQLPSLPERNIIVEPEGRNTAPCINLSAQVIKRYYKNSTMVVLPSDHLIKNEEKFIEIVKEGSKFLNDKKEAIITLGMTPDRPETGYGYIKQGNVMKLINEHYIVNVDKFVEKPKLEIAKEYLQSGNYLWNGGIFMWQIDEILKKIKEFMPKTYEALKNISKVPESKLREEINNNYKNTEAISIDYGILEKSKDIYVIPSDIGWDDVGSWEAVERYKDKDSKGNIHMGNIKTLNGSQNLAISTSSKVIIDGLSDIYVIENDGKIIIGKKENVNKVKELQNLV